MVTLFRKGSLSHSVLYLTTNAKMPYSYAISDVFITRQRLMGSSIYVSILNMLSLFPGCIMLSLGLVNSCNLLYPKFVIRTLHLNFILT